MAYISDADVQAALGARCQLGPGLHIQLPKDATEDWSEHQKRIREQLDHFHETAVNSSPVKHRSVFAIGPIPLLMVLGRELGEASTADVYNHHREPPGWAWGHHPPAASAITLHHPRERTTPAVAVLMSISGRIAHEAVDAFMPYPRYATFEIIAEEPRVNLLRTQEQLTDFKDIWRRTLAAINSNYPGIPVYLFPALPPAAAVAVGQCIMPNIATIHACNWHSQDLGFQYALTLEGQALAPHNPQPLAALLARLFTDESLTELLLRLPSGRAVLNSLPKPASLQSMALHSARELLRREPIDAIQAAVSDVRPHQQDVIEATFSQYSVPD